jgi:hypothetical protein
MQGQCMCGAVSYEAKPDLIRVSACHCEMCRRWSGSALMAVAVPEDKVRFEGAEHIRKIQSSPWAERAWCGECGSNLYYRVTAEGPYQGQYHISLGTFDAPGKFDFYEEIYTDCKPANFAYAGERSMKTKAEIEAMFAFPPAGDKP